MARLLLSLFGTSDFLSKRFLRHPELLDTLLRQDSVVLAKEKLTFRRELDERLADAAGRGQAGLTDDRLEAELGELRRYKDEEVLRIALHDIAGALPLAGVAEQLSDLAEACIERGLDLAEAEARKKGRLPRVRLCIVAMGKLGGRELGYHSDLDLVFLYRDAPEGESHGEHARLAQRLISFLQMPLREGLLYKIDTRLRPSGNQGALVTSASGFARYHGGQGGDAPVRSQLWERQALLRARFAAGDARLFEEIRDQVLVPAVWSRPASNAALAAEIRRMRERIEAELGKEAARGPNPKAGRGGLIDVEFAAQYLQLAHGHAHPGIRTTCTERSHALVAGVGWIGRGDSHRVGPREREARSVQGRSIEAELPGRKSEVCDSPYLERCLHRREHLGQGGVARLGGACIEQHGTGQRGLEALPRALLGLPDDLRAPLHQLEREGGVHARHAVVRRRQRGHRVVASIEQAVPREEQRRLQDLQHSMQHGRAGHRVAAPHRIVPDSDGAGRTRRERQAQTVVELLVTDREGCHLRAAALGYPHGHLQGGQVRRVHEPAKPALANLRAALQSRRRAGIPDLSQQHGDLAHGDLTSAGTRRRSPRADIASG